MAARRRFVGIDGSKGAWLAALLDGSRIQFRRQPKLAALLSELSPDDCILIDIPIGLYEDRGEARECERLARELLGQRRSSVFVPPCRPALAAAGRPLEVIQLQRKATGKGVSIQCANLAPYLKDADETLRSLSGKDPRPRESHPELAFWSLAGGRSMDHNKTTPAGRKERLATLALHARRAEEFQAAYERALQELRRKDAARDDILDALALAALGRTGGRGLRSLPEDPPQDAYGLPMEMVYLPPRTQVAFAREG